MRLTNRRRRTSLVARTKMGLDVCGLLARRRTCRANENRLSELERRRRSEKFELAAEAGPRRLRLRARSACRPRRFPRRKQGASNKLPSRPSPTPPKSSRFGAPVPMPAGRILKVEPFARLQPQLRRRAARQWPYIFLCPSPTHQSHVVPVGVLVVRSANSLPLCPFAIGPYPPRSGREI